MKFDYLIKTCELERRCKAQEYSKFTNVVLSKLNEYMLCKKKENPSISTAKILNEIKQLVFDYLVKITDVRIYENAISYYTNKKIYSKTNNLKSVYDKVNKMDQTKEIDIINQPDLLFTTNIDKNLENLFRSFMKEIRIQKNKLMNTNGFYETFKAYKTGNTKEMNRRFQKLENELFPGKDIANSLKKTFQLFSKSEFELCEERIKEFTELQGKELKTNLVKSIIESVKLLDTFGMMEYYTYLNNKSYKKIYINDIDYKYNEVMELLTSEEKLKQQNTESLIMMSAFWTNRVNKVIKDLNKAFYIMEHEELQERKSENEGCTIGKEDNSNLELKMLFLHKVYFELFQEIQRSSTEKYEINISGEIDEIESKMGREYKQYFSKVFPNSENSLKKDLMVTDVFENIRFNSYQLKDIAIQSVIICLANNEFNNIENFGYIDEKNSRKEALIAVDLKGYNMYFALHCNKNDLREFWKETAGTSEFPIYEGAQDFVISDDNEILKAQIFVPLTQDATKKIENATNKLTPKDRYANTVRHLAYLTKNGKMPNHMLEECKGGKKGKKYKFVRKYINLDEDEGFNLGIKKIKDKSLEEK